MARLAMSNDMFVGDLGRDGSITRFRPLVDQVHTVERGQASSEGLLKPLGLHHFQRFYRSQDSVHEKERSVG